MILTSEISSWLPDCAKTAQQDIAHALEHGRVICFPNLPFPLFNDELCLLSPQILNSKAKNISYNSKTKCIKGTSLDPKCSSVIFPNGYHALNRMMSRYSQNTYQLIHRLIPHYQKHLVLGRTSYRPAEIAGRVRSVRQDDTRLHVDAFPTTPTHGNRILRVFCNINPNQQARVWHLGEPFKEVVNQFKTSLSKPFPGLRSILHWVNLTKSYRSLYDHYMLQLHNAMKESDTYQKNVQKISQYFPSGATWIVMTDQVSHAALSGQYVLEQTFYLPVSAMHYPEQSPLKVLEETLSTRLL